MNLLELQRRMTADVTRPLTADFQMQSATEDGVPVAELAASYIKPNPQLTSFDRLEIYNRQYWFRVIGAVSEDFPALGALVGERKFDALILAYLRDTPSTSYTLRDLSARLPEWLTEHPEFAGRRQDLAVDVARLEWAYVEAFDRAALPPLTPADFGQITAESTLRLQPHLQLLSLRYPVDELVLAVHREHETGEIMSNAVSERKHIPRPTLPRMRRSPVQLAVHRYEHVVYYRRIDPEAFLLLSALQAGATLASALESAFAESSLAPDEQAKKIEEYFAHAAELGWFCLPDADPASAR